MTQWSLHQVGIESVNLLAVLHDSAFKGGEVWGALEFSSLLQMPGSEAWIACVGQQPVGMILVRGCVGEIEIITLGVKPGARRCGLGRALLNVFLQRVCQQGGCVFLEVNVKNHAAEALYRAAGFKRVGYRPHYYSDGSDAYLFKFSCEK